MDLDMWKHPATRANMERLQSYGVRLIPVGHGELASGLVGDGRMAEPEDIVIAIQALLQEKKGRLAGKKALVTAGPTFEPLDPVRFIGNHSSGKMGIAIAEALANEGASVTLVLGPTDLRPMHPAIQVAPVMTAQEMYQSCETVFEQMDIAVLAAAVADYRPKIFSDTKIKKKDGDLTLDLEKTVDIAATLGKNKKPGQLLVGFALETNDETQNALLKLEKKNLDFIVLNSMRDEGAGFGHDTNKISILRRNGSREDFPLRSKSEVASDILTEICRTANPNVT
jgi:phosphopantothenoylcysteine decarboxylase/phosphopantothenate--cysteine ligase